MEVAQIGTNFSFTQDVLKLCETFSKLDCVSFIRKNRFQSNSEWHENCRLLILSEIFKWTISFQLSQMRKLNFSFFQAV